LLLFVVGGGSGVVRGAFERLEFAERVIDVQRPEQLASKLALLRRSSGPKVVLIGDSLIFGRTMREHGDREWRSHTLARALQRKLPHAKVFNFGINGSLPADLAALAPQLVAAGADLVVFDVHLRAFSKDFSEPDAQLARPWLAELRLDEAGNVASPPGAGLRAQASRRIARLTLRPQRDYLQAILGESETLARGPELRRKLLGLRAPTLDVVDEALLSLKIKKRLANLDLSPKAPQVKALRSLLDVLEAAGVPALAFYAREEPKRLREVMAPGTYSRRRAELEAHLLPRNGARFQYVGPIATLKASHYLDISHLNAAGYEIVADVLEGPCKKLLAKEPS
jgi:lysophospholipase L1-like esterase